MPQTPLNGVDQLRQAIMISMLELVGGFLAVNDPIELVDSPAQMVPINIEPQLHCLVICVSGLAVHTRNIQARDRVSLMIMFDAVTILSFFIVMA